MNVGKTSNVLLFVLLTQERYGQCFKSMADGLLAGTVCLAPALAGSLGDADVAHVVGNMGDEGLNI